MMARVSSLCGRATTIESRSDTAISATMTTRNAWALHCLGLSESSEKEGVCVRLDAWALVVSLLMAASSEQAALAAGSGRSANARWVGRRMPGKGCRVDVESGGRLEIIAGWGWGDAKFEEWSRWVSESAGNEKRATATQ